MKRVFVDFDNDDFDILNKIVIDGNYSSYIRNFLKKELFAKLTISHKTPSHIQYYEEVERLMKLLKLRQQELADQLGYSQAAIAKSFKTRNDRSVIYHTMTQHGTPDNFIYDVYLNLLQKDEFYSDAGIIRGDVDEYFETFIKDHSTRKNCLNFIEKLSCFSYRVKPKKHNISDFVQAIKRLNKKLFLNLDKSLIIENENRSGERLFTALTEYYLSLEF